MEQIERAKIKFLQLLLVPAIKYCVRNSIVFGELIEALKVLFIEKTVEELRNQGIKESVSQISIITGINRPDVTRIHLKQGDNKQSVNLITRVIGQWEQDKRFRTKSGVPKVLSFRGTRGNKSEFKSLVETVSKDLGPAPVLAELERMGVVEKTEEGLKLVKKAQYHFENPEKGYEILAKDTETMALSVEENLFTVCDPKNLHVRTEYDNIYKEDLDKIREWLFRKGLSFHKQVRDFISKYDQDITPNPLKTGGGRVVITSFSWTRKEPLK